MKFLAKNKPIFDKYGGYYHLRISSIKDLKHVLELPDGRWMATSCPVFGLNMDSSFLKFLDADGNNRIISDEVRESIKWMLNRVKITDSTYQNQPYLPLNLINIDTPEGKLLKDSAERVLKNLGILNSDNITLEQVRNRQSIMAKANYNGDGVIPPEVLDNQDTAQFIRDIISTIGSVDDASGLKGINESILEQFKSEARSYLEWYNQGIIPEGKENTPIMIYGTKTPEMYNTISGIREKIDQFFAQSALLKINPNITEQLIVIDEKTERFDYNDTKSITERLKLAPIYKPNPEGVLILDENYNEVYHSVVQSFKENVYLPIFGDTAFSLNKFQWENIIKKFSAYESWIKAKPVTKIESLGVDKIRNYLDSHHEKIILDLIAKDKSVSEEIQQLQNLERLLAYHRWLIEFVNNYVSFPYLFSISHRAMFDTGTLILGGREYTFSIKVENKPAHINIAKNSGICLMYLQVTGSKPEETFEIAVPVTRGNLKDTYIGKRGIFFTVNGKEMDAQIVHIIENPISLWETIKEPFRRVYAMISSRFSQIAQAIQKESEKTIINTQTDQKTIQSSLTQTQQITTAPIQQSTTIPLATESNRTSGNIRDIMIGVGFLAAGLGTALKFLTDTARQLTQPRTLQILLIMIGIFLGVAILTAGISGWIRLRQRDMGILLQASGWSINGKMRIIRPMARFFCRKVKIPKGAKKYRKELLTPIEKLARKIQFSSDK